MQPHLALPVLDLDLHVPLGHHLHLPRSNAPMPGSHIVEDCCIKCHWHVSHRIRVHLKPSLVATTWKSALSVFPSHTAGRNLSSPFPAEVELELFLQRLPVCLETSCHSPDSPAHRLLWSQQASNHHQSCHRSPQKRRWSPRSRPHHHAELLYKDANHCLNRCTSCHKFPPRPPL